jgi:hypothetical protein
MKPSLARVPVLATERPSNAGQLLFWLLGRTMARHQRGPSKVAINSITLHQPYCGLRDLERVPLFPRLGEGPTASLPVHNYLPSALRLVRHGCRGTPLWRCRESAG